MTELQKPEIKTKDLEFKPELDFKVTKSDVVDMIVAEREEYLDSLLKENEEKKKAVENKVEKLEKDFNKKFKSDANKKLKKLLNALKEHYKVTLDFDSGSFSVKDCRRAFEAYTDVSVDVISLKSRRSWGETLPEFGDGFFLNAEKSEEFKKAKPLLKEIQSLFEEAEGYRAEKQQLNKKGKRALSRIVKDLLGRTDEGNNILQSIPSLARQNLLKGQ